ncbi:MAG TPA: translation factor GTPase family protein, partial [Gemmataceae bacterium]
GNPVAVNIPIGSGSIKDSAAPFSGIIDLIDMQALYFDPADQGKTFRTEPIPDKLRLAAQKWREKLFDQLTQHDEQDQLTSAYLEGRDIAADKIRAVLREQTLKRLIQPVLCGSGREHIGIQSLLDAATWYLPNPLDRPPVTGVNPKKKDKEEKRKPDPKEPFCGLVFKIVADVKGELYFVRIYSGTLKSQSRPYNPGRECKEMVSKIYHTEADPRQRTEVHEAYAGDIVALIGMKESITGDTLCDVQHPILLERIQFAEAVVSRSIEPESSADKDKLISTLNVLRKEDPTFTWNTDKDTGQTLMNGMGMLHLEIKQHRMERDFRLKVRVGQPRVSYRETLRGARTVTGECIKQAGQAGLFAKLEVAFEPHKGEESIVVESRLPPDTLPPLFVAAAEQGVKGALDSGELGFPVMNVKAVLLGGEMDEQLSNDTAFRAAGADAVRRAMRDNIVLLEPWMKLEVIVPDEFLGPVLSDINARRAEIKKLENRDGICSLETIVPLSEMFDYADRVRSLSQGRASSSMEPYRYQAAPEEVLRRLLHPEGEH